MPEIHGSNPLIRYTNLLLIINVKFLFIYKTTHKNGKYYIGRHQTDNLDDGYMGSGNWIKSIKDKSSLSREILCFVDDEKGLHKMEEKYINECYDDPLNMNFKRASLGSTSEDNLEKVRNGTHNFLKRPDGSSIGRDLANSSKSKKKKKESISKIQKSLVKNGTHHWLKKLDGSSIGRDIANSPEAKKKKKETFVNIEHQKGSKNSQYGTMWIYSLELKQNKKILKTDPIPEGWIKGRKKF